MLDLFAQKYKLLSRVFKKVCAIYLKGGRPEGKLARFPLVRNCLNVPYGVITAASQNSEPQTNQPSVKAATGSSPLPCNPEEGRFCK